MKYEIKNAENTFLKTFIILIFYIFALFFSMYSFSMKQCEEIEIFNKILNYLSYPAFREYNFIENLLYIFNNMYFVLYFAIFYIYELICLHNNIATRYNEKKWIIHKYFIGIVAIIVISLIQYGCIYYVFKCAMPKLLKYYLYPILYKIFIMSCLYTLYNTFKTNKLAFTIFLLITICFLYYFNFILYTVLILFTFIVNYMFFDLKVLKYMSKKK